MVLVAGRVSDDSELLMEHGVSAVVPILRRLTSLEQALADGPTNVEHAVAAIIRLMQSGRPQ